MRRFVVAVVAALVLVGAALNPARAQNAQLGPLCTTATTPADKQIEACNKIIALKVFSGTQLATTYFWRAIAWNKKGDYGKVIDDATEALRLAPNTQAALNLRGSAYFDKGEYDIAIADHTDAIKAGPPNSTLYHDRGNAYRGKKDYVHAIADYGEAIRLQPNAYSYQNRGLAKEALGDLDGALADINDAIRLDPRLPPPLISRSVLWRAKGDYDHAIADAERSIMLIKGGTALAGPKTPPGSWLVNSYVNRGLAFEGHGDIDKAKADFTAALAVPVSDAGSKATQATARARLAMLDKAETLPARPATNSAGGRRVALVIGNGAYAHVTALPNPPNDARTVARTLRDLGFEVTEGINADHAGLEKLTRDFVLSTIGAKIALLYYAGHGVQIDGRNFLVPTDISRDSAPNLVNAMADMDTILAGLEDQVRTNILIFDACRNNPFAADKPAEPAPAGRGIAITTGLATPGALGAGATAGAGTLIAFATAPGKVALDGDGANSPFSTALSKHMATPGLELQQMLTRVRADVVATTNNQQVPWSNSSLLGEVFLAGAR
jgi:tetratricopeptide (TPR) repeat protein